jgi:hypothetical protein
LHRRIIILQRVSHQQDARGTARPRMVTQYVCCTNHPAAGAGSANYPAPMACPWSTRRHRNTACDNCGSARATVSRTCESQSSVWDNDSINLVNTCQRLHSSDTSQTQGLPHYMYTSEAADCKLISCIDHLTTSTSKKFTPRKPSHTIMPSPASRKRMISLSHTDTVSEPAAL